MWGDVGMCGEKGTERPSTLTSSRGDSSKPAEAGSWGGGGGGAPADGSLPSAPPPADAIAPEFFGGLSAQPKGTSVVDQVFTKEAELRARRCSGDARGAR